MEKKITREEEKKLEREIDCWKIHLETIDKTNIDISNSNYVALFSLLLALFATFTIGIMSFDDVYVVYRLIGAVIILIMFAYAIIKIKNKYDKEIKHHHLSLVLRERMLRERYELLGVDREKLDGEFEDIKKIYKNPTSSMRDFLIKEYYKKKRDGR
ncbi:hypothetical protein COU62_01830 [Candidatus Pacearchaeota archaeon CG10_big_fil_rev_8_21_14_0_10_35_219]|nr:MAG: hypothetical protein COU62_01830 [Candidatus Pacearchaeota archaeon CG10_big_fil_rev_8_21_14_0_10_35_219]